MEDNESASPNELARGWGRIVNVSSGIVDRLDTMVAGNVYAATKSALEAHTLNLVDEFEDTGVSVNVYRPGTVDNPMQGYIRDRDPDQVKGGLVERSQCMQADRQPVTPDASARTWVARLTGSETHAGWTFEAHEHSVQRLYRLDRVQRATRSQRQSPDVPARA